MAATGLPTRRPVHAHSSRSISLRRPCLARIGKRSLSLSLLRSRFTTRDEYPHPGHPPNIAGARSRVCPRASCGAQRRRTPKQAEPDASEPWMASEV